MTCRRAKTEAAAAVMRIMIVEDESLLALDLEQLLRTAGHDTIGPATTANHAYELIEAESPDLALVDIRLADGDTGTAIARELWDRYRVPIVLVTASTADRPDYAEAALGHLAKPVAPTALLRSIEVVRRIMNDEPVKAEDVPANLRLFVSL
jgi:DNA-binding response OmpR family regulator